MITDKQVRLSSFQAWTIGKADYATEVRRGEKREQTLARLLTDVTTKEVESDSKVEIAVRVELIILIMTFFAFLIGRMKPGLTSWI